MIAFIVRRTLLAASTVAMLSLITFPIVQLPEGSYLDTYIDLAQSGEGGAGEIRISPQEIEALMSFWGLDQPLYIQYAKWVWNMARFDFGQSFDQTLPVIKVIGERLPLTVVLAVFTVICHMDSGDSDRDILRGPAPLGRRLHLHVRRVHRVERCPIFYWGSVLMYFVFVYFDLSVGGQRWSRLSEQRCPV